MTETAEDQVEETTTEDDDESGGDTTLRSRLVLRTGSTVDVRERVTTVHNYIKKGRLDGSGMARFSVSPKNRIYLNIDALAYVEELVR